jgi:hypothetical protein
MKKNMLLEVSGGNVLSDETGIAISQEAHAANSRQERKAKL